MTGGRAAQVMIRFVLWFLLWVGFIAPTVLSQSTLSPPSGEQQPDFHEIQQQRLLQVREKGNEEEENFEYSSASLKKMMRPPNKSKRFQRMLTMAAKALPTGLVVKHLNSTPTVRPNHNAIIACALSLTYTPRDVNNFVGTARKAGFLGDIVIAVLPQTQAAVLARFQQFNATIFTVDTTCFTKDKVNVLCSYRDRKDIPVSLLRFFVYQEIAPLYQSTSNILIADYRDVFFQSNPFKHKASIAMNKPSDLLVFLEAHPNRVLNRCNQNYHFINLCYGKSVINSIGSNTVSSSGLVLGRKDAIQVYSYLITTQIDPRMRDVFNSTATDPNNCLRFGVDSGFHNVLLYMNILSNYLDVKMYQQGEGPVNIVGGYFGDAKILRAFLSDWKIIRGEAPYKYVYNWNGEISPVVHQLDRFM